MNKQTGKEMHANLVKYHVYQQLKKWILKYSAFSLLSQVVSIHTTFLLYLTLYIL